MEHVVYISIALLVGFFLPMVTYFIDLINGEPDGEKLGDPGAIFRKYGMWVNKNYIKFWNKEAVRLKKEINPDLSDERISILMKPNPWKAWGACPKCMNSRLAVILSPAILFIVSFPWQMALLYWLPTSIVAAFAFRIYQRILK